MPSIRVGLARRKPVPPRYSADANRPRHIRIGHVLALPKQPSPVRKGERGSLVVYASTLHRTDRDEASGEEIERDIPYMKGYTVFNVEQIDGLPEQYTPPAQTILDPVQRVDHADAFFAATGANVRHGGNLAYYTQGEDRIQLPPFEAFRDAESYYTTLGHESIHWTKHKNRLDREFGRKRWGDKGYAAEELVAELGAAFLCADLTITPEVREDHAAYIDNWLTILKGDKRAIFTAAAHAQRAVDFLHRFSGKAEQQDAESLQSEAA
ncbi:zincin-like metallopeptidase domain-containing protein [Rhizobium leguminosarum]|uniref:ArdC family protein n=1 Tax=Rhizobium leguminosarum TaxID=384 RepID=UPI001C948B5D|nr:antirestriction protein [Rhizobium leguminosarum]MBY5664964.1 antirestriction protein [Rhizobium leguminosarum]MBY5677552.1 antirestriction protein [Rhizobium leguminosarum]